MITDCRTPRVVRCHLPACFALGVLFAWCAPSAHAIPIAGTALDVTWDVSHDAVADLFEYRYHIENTGLVDIVDGVRLTVAEDPTGTHTGLHDEVGILADGGVFSYDRVKAGFPLHNYDWDDLDIAAGATVTVGFDDVHAPTMAPWEIETAAVSFTEFVLGMPVPFIGDGPEGFPGRPGGGLGEICVVTVEGDLKCYRHEASVVIPDPAGFAYLKFLRNTGDVPIGPDAPLPAPPDNHADHWEAEHPTHVPFVHEVFPLVHPFITDNGCATAFGQAAAAHVDASGAVQGAVPGPPNYFWHGLGDGGGGVECVDGDWDVGAVITVGFTDPHGPALTAWGGAVVGSESFGFFPEPANAPVNPAVPIAEPAPLLPALLALSAAFVASRSRARSRRQQRHRV